MIRTLIDAFSNFLFQSQINTCYQLFESFVLMRSKNIPPPGAPKKRIPAPKINLPLLQTEPEKQEPLPIDQPEAERPEKLAKNVVNEEAVSPASLAPQQQQVESSPVEESSFVPEDVVETVIEVPLPKRKAPPAAPRPPVVKKQKPGPPTRVPNPIIQNPISEVQSQVNSEVQAIESVVEQKSAVEAETRQEAVYINSPEAKQDQSPQGIKQQSSRVDLSNDTLPQEQAIESVKTATESIKPPLPSPLGKPAARIPNRGPAPPTRIINRVPPPVVKTETPQSIKPVTTSNQSEKAEEVTETPSPFLKQQKTETVRSEQIKSSVQPPVRPSSPKGLKPPDKQTKPVIRVEEAKEVVQNPIVKPSSPKNIKTQIILPTKSTQKVTVPPSQPLSSSPAVKSKMSQKLEELRRAKEQMLNEEQSFDQEDDEEEDEQQGEEEQAESPYDQPDAVKEAKVEEKREVIQREEVQTVQKQQETKSQLIVHQVPEQVVVEKTVPKIAPPAPIKAAILGKPPVRQVPSPAPKKIAPPQLQKPKIEQAKVQQVPQPQTLVKEQVEKVEQRPQFPIESLPQAENPFPAVKIEQKTEIKQQPIAQHTISVRLSQPKPNSEINNLLQRYHGLKSGYLNNLRQLDELIHFQRQQEESEIDKINHLLSELHKKNAAIKEICSIQELPSPQEEEEIAV